MASTRERIGRPTQFHGVPVEERAFDSLGNRLPWALEWADDHPNARLQKRQPEEKGSFGKSTRRTGTIRGSKSQTPAKRENPTLDGFEAAFKSDSRNGPQQQPLSTNQGAADTTQRKPPSIKEPYRVMLYGYTPETQWAAIAHYEKVSGGIICEDYEREPPTERRRFQIEVEHAGHFHPRPLTKEEKSFAMQYQGGRSWIKVTFDSVEAGERAISASPHAISGCWVYAEPFRGRGRDIDEPICVREEDRQQGLLGAPKPTGRAAQTLGPSFSMAALTAPSFSGAATLPRSFTAPKAQAQAQGSSHEPVQAELSSTTESSATALEIEYPQLRHRATSHIEGRLPTNGNATGAVSLVQSGPRSFTHFPDTPRTILKPAAEAFLPQPSWTEKVLKQLSQSGWIPGDMIGSTVPRLDNGEFDFSKTSLYWRICYWFDTQFGMDICGLKES